MIIKIEVGDQSREFYADYDRLHNKDWNNIVRDMLDDENKLKEF